MVEGLLANPSGAQETFILSEIKQALNALLLSIRKKNAGILIN